MTRREAAECTTGRGSKMALEVQSFSTTKHAVGYKPAWEAEETHIMTKETCSLICSTGHLHHNW